MIKSNNCLLIVNNVSKNDIIDMASYIDQGLSKLSEVLENFPASLLRFTSLYQDKFEKDVEFKDEENNVKIRLLIQPTYKQLKEALNKVSADDLVTENYIVYIGSYSSGYCSDWLLKDGIMSANTMFHIFTPDNIFEDSHHPINLFIPGNSLYWKKILSKLKINDSNQELVKVFSFSTEKDPSTQLTTDCTEKNDLATFSKIIYEHFRPLMNENESLSCFQSPGVLQLTDKNGSLYIFDEGCGQSSLLALNGFNLLVDAGYNHSPEFWNFLQRLDRIDTCLLTTWNKTNIFGMENFLELQSKPDRIGPPLNYCILPMGPNISKPFIECQLKSSLEINLELEALSICKQLQTLEVPLSQISRDEKSLKLPHQLYFKLGHGCLEVFPLWPCCTEISGDFKRYMDEWHKMDKGQSIHFDEMVKDHSTACLLLWSGTKITDINDNPNHLMRVLITSSCHETQLIKAFEEFSKTNNYCNSRTGKPLETKVDDKKHKPVSLLHKIGGDHDVKDNNKLPAKDVHCDAHVLKNKLSVDPSKTKKITDNKKPSSNIENTKTNGVSKTEPLIKTKDNKSLEKSPPSKDQIKIEKKSGHSEKTGATKEPAKVAKKHVPAEKSALGKDLVKGEKKPAVSATLVKGKEVAKPENKQTSSDKSAKPKEAVKIDKKPAIQEKVVNVKKVEKEDTKPTKAQATTANISNKTKGDIAPKTKLVKVDHIESHQSSKPTSAKSSEMHEDKKKPLPEVKTKKPAIDLATKNNNLNKKNTGIKSEGDKVPNKSSAVAKTAKNLVHSATSDLKQKSSNKVVAEGTVNKIDIESDPDKIEGACQYPSISLNTDDTLNNVDTSELLGKLEEVGTIPIIGTDDQINATVDVRDLHSVPLSDLMTESPEHPKTEEDVEPLKTDGLSIDQDLVNVNEELPEDERITCAKKENENSKPFEVDESVEHGLDKAKHLDYLKEFGIYEDDNSEIVDDIYDDQQEGKEKNIDDQHSTEIILEGDIGSVDNNISNKEKIIDKEIELHESEKTKEKESCIGNENDEKNVDDIVDENYMDMNYKSNVKMEIHVESISEDHHPVESTKNETQQEDTAEEDVLCNDDIILNQDNKVEHFEGNIEYHNTDHDYKNEENYRVHQFEDNITSGEHTFESEEDVIHKSNDDVEILERQIEDIHNIECGDKGIYKDDDNVDIFKESMKEIDSNNEKENHNEGHERVGEVDYGYQKDEETIRKNDLKVETEDKIIHSKNNDAKHFEKQIENDNNIIHKEDDTAESIEEKIDEDDHNIESDEDIIPKKGDTAESSEEKIDEEDHNIESDEDIVHKGDDTAESLEEKIEEDEHKVESDEDIIPKKGDTAESFEEKIDEEDHNIESDEDIVHKGDDNAEGLEEKIEEDEHKVESDEDEHNIESDEDIIHKGDNIAESLEEKIDKDDHNIESDEDIIHKKDDTAESLEEDEEDHKSKSDEDSINKEDDTAESVEEKIHEDDLKIEDNEDDILHKDNCLKSLETNIKDLDQIEIQKNKMTNEDNSMESSEEIIRKEDHSLQIYEEKNYKEDGVESFDKGNKEEIVACNEDKIDESSCNEDEIIEKNIHSELEFFEENEDVNLRKDEKIKEFINIEGHEMYMETEECADNHAEKEYHVVNHENKIEEKDCIDENDEDDHKFQKEIEKNEYDLKIEKKYGFQSSDEEINESTLSGIEIDKSKDIEYKEGFIKEDDHHFVENFEEEIENDDDNIEKEKEMLINKDFVSETNQPFSFKQESSNDHIKENFQKYDDIDRDETCILKNEHDEFEQSQENIVKNDNIIDENDEIIHEDTIKKEDYLFENQEKDVIDPVSIDEENTNNKDENNDVKCFEEKFNEEEEVYHQEKNDECHNIGNELDNIEKDEHNDIEEIEEGKHGIIHSEKNIKEINYVEDDNCIKPKEENIEDSYHHDEEEIQTKDIDASFENPSDNEVEDHNDIVENEEENFEKTDSDNDIKEKNVLKYEHQDLEINIQHIDKDNHGNERENDIIEKAADTYADFADEMPAHCLSSDNDNFDVSKENIDHFNNNDSTENVDDDEEKNSYDVSYNLKDEHKYCPYFEGQIGSNDQVQQSDNLDEHKPDIIPFGDDLCDYTPSDHEYSNKFDNQGKYGINDFEPPYYSPDLNSASPADSDLSADIVRDHNVSEETIDNIEQGNMKVMTPLDELSEEGFSPGAFHHEDPESNISMGAYRSDEDIRNITDLEVDPNLSIITPDIIKGLKRTNLSGEVEVEEVIEDEELFQYQTTRIPTLDPKDSQDALGNTKKITETSSESQPVTNFSDVSAFEEHSTMDNFSNVSERGSSVESASSVLAQKSTDNEFDFKNIVSSKSITDNDSPHTADTDPLSQWNLPLGLPMPAIPAPNKPTTKTTDSKASDRNKPSSSSSKVKSPPTKVNGSLPSNATKLAQKPSDSPKSTPSPRSSVTPKSSAKATELTKQPKKTEPVDHCKFPAFYVDVAYVPVDHDGNVSQTRVTEAFFTRIRAHQYILPGLEHDPLVLDSLLAAKKKWSESESEAEVRLIPIKMTETLVKWAGEHASEMSRLNVKIGAAVENCSVSLGGSNSITSAAHRIDF